MPPEVTIQDGEDKGVVAMEDQRLSLWSERVLGWALATVLSLATFIFWRENERQDEVILQISNRLISAETISASQSTEIAVTKSNMSNIDRRMERIEGLLEDIRKELQER